MVQTTVTLLFFWKICLMISFPVIVFLYMGKSFALKGLFLWKSNPSLNDHFSYKCCNWFVVTLNPISSCIIIFSFPPWNTTPLKYSSLFRSLLDDILLKFYSCIELELKCIFNRFWFARTIFAHVSLKSPSTLKYSKYKNFETESKWSDRNCKNRNGSRSILSTAK